MDAKTRKRVSARFLEFLIIGLVMGVVEDLIAIHFATEAEITPHIFKIAFLVALPFAVISELVVDNRVFRNLFFGSPNHSQKSSGKKGR